MDFLYWLVLVLFIFICVFLILLVLIQKGRGGGLSGAFGGAGGNTAFGSKTGDVLTWTTSVVFGIFIVLAIGLNLLANHQQDTLNAKSLSAGSGMTNTPAPPPTAPRRSLPPIETLPPALPAPTPTTAPSLPAAPTTAPSAVEIPATSGPAVPSLPAPGPTTAPTTQP